MTRVVHVALARVYRSSSGYGTKPFAVPAGSPVIVPVGSEVLEVHLGDAPAWLKRAEARVPILGGAMMMGVFRNSPADLQELRERLSQAKDRALAKDKDNWLVTVVLRWHVEWPQADVSDDPRLWPSLARLLETEKAANQRVPSLDLAARVLRIFLPHVFDEIVVSDRVYVGRDDSFADAFGMPQFTAGAVGMSIRSDLDRIEAVLAGGEMHLALANAVAAPAVPKDAARPDRLKAALHSDLLADDGGSYGRYELLREMQPVLMQASKARPMSVMFVDMNGLKQINDKHGHRAGDEAIAEFRSAVRESHHGALFRTGGDEFVLFSIGAPEDAPKLARTIIAAVSARHVHGTPLSASVGVVLATDPREEPDSIIERADREMYRAKEESRRHPRPCTLAVEGGEPEVLKP